MADGSIPELMASARHMFLVAGLILPRMGALFTLAPVLGGKSIHGVIRNAILLSFVLMVYPMVAPSMAGPSPSWPVIFAVIAKEMAVGMLMGFVVGIAFWAVEGVGYLIDNQRGTTMASVVDPLSGEQTSPMGSFFLQVLIVLFFSTGGFLALLAMVFESYRVWPVFSFYPHLDVPLVAFFLSRADHLMLLILLWSSPIVIALFVSEFGLGLINRFSPQLNVFFLSMPIKSAVAGALLILYVSFLLGYSRDELGRLDQALAFLQGVVR